MWEKIIAVTPNWDDTGKKIWIPMGYFSAILRSGGLPVLLPLTTDTSEDTSDIELIAERFDGFIFSGGGDILPELYREEQSEHCVNVYKNRDDMEIALFNEAILKRDKPAFGICRGLQLFNVALGGTLYQDLLSERENSLNHRQGIPYNKPYHAVDILHDNPLYTLFQSETVMVNSYHHQGVKKLASPLVKAALARDGLIEAAFLPDRRFALAVQWHPEEIPDEKSSRQLFAAFMAAVK